MTSFFLSVNEQRERRVADISEMEEELGGFPLAVIDKFVPTEPESFPVLLLFAGGFEEMGKDFVKETSQSLSIAGERNENA